MITTLDEALEQNKRLVAEAFRVTQMYNKSQAELQRLKKGMSPTADPSNNEREDFLREMSRAEELLKEKDEVNKNLARALEQTELQYYDADHRAKAANVQLLSGLEMLRKKEELLAAKLKSSSFEDKSGLKSKVEEYSAQLLDKEVQLAVYTKDMIETVQLLDAAQAQVQKFNDERLLLFDHSKKLKLSSHEIEEKVKESEQKMQAMMEIQTAKENELQQTTYQKHQLANVIFQLEKKIAGLELKNKALESELAEYKHRHQTAEQAAQPQLRATQDYGGSNFMSQVMENMQQMQMEIQRLSQQQNAQINRQNH